MTKRLACIVEGRGDVEALPRLCQSLLARMEAWEWSVYDQAIRQPRARLVDTSIGPPHRTCNIDGLRRALALAAARPADAVLILCDSDDDCPKSWRVHARDTVAPLLKRPPFETVMAVREYESWLLSGRGEDELRKVKAADPETVRGAKERLAKLVPGYKPTTHQLELTRTLDLDLALRRSRSLRRLQAAVASLCGPR